MIDGKPFIFAVELDANTVLPALQKIGVDLSRILHGVQQFSYFDTI